MGSVALFPRARPAAVSLAWRSWPADSGEALVREARLDDLAGIRSLSPLSLRELEHRIQAFSAGTLVAVRDGRIVGWAAAVRREWPVVSSLGSTLHVDTLALDAATRGHGAGRLLLLAQRSLCRRLNLRRLAVTLPMPSAAPEDHALRVLWGDAPDATWRLLASQGFQYCGVVRDFLPSGPAALFAWLNPLHTPPSPPASARECA